MAAKRHGKAALIALAGDLAFAKLTRDPEELLRFMNVAGYDPATLRAALGSPSLSRGMIEYVAQNEGVMLAVCGEGGITPEDFMAAYQALNPGHEG